MVYFATVGALALAAFLWIANEQMARRQQRRKPVPVRFPDCCIVDTRIRRIVAGIVFESQQRKLWEEACARDPWKLSTA
jgi:hypothetical protein